MPTFAFPATAATRASEKGAVSCATVSVANSVSLSSATTTSPRASAKPRFSADDFPPFALEKIRTRGFRSNFSRSTASVRSLDPSSTQTTSSTAGCCPSKVSTVRAITCSSL